MTKVKILCPHHGLFEQVPRDHISGTGCPKCGRNQANQSIRLSLNEFIKKANITHSNKYNYSNVIYTNAQTKVCIICPEHGEFWQRPSAHVFGHGCPKCRLVGLTRLFNKLKERFPFLEIIFEADKKDINWIGNLRIDIYIPIINFAIELMGPQHYEEIPYFKNGSSLEITLERDIRKRIKCKLNNCTLIELKYYYTKEDFENLVLEVTKKLEELAKEGTDEAAIEAGKLLVDEILNNTIDNTNNIL